MVATRRIDVATHFGELSRIFSQRGRSEHGHAQRYTKQKLHKAHKRFRHRKVPFPYDHYDWNIGEDILDRQNTNSLILCVGRLSRCRLNRIDETVRHNGRIVDAAFFLEPQCTILPNKRVDISARVQNFRHFV